MNFLILTFLSSLTITTALIWSQRFHKNISSDYDLSGPQKFHVNAVPRIGGIGIFISILISSLIATLFFNLEKGELLLQLLVCAFPSFAGGFIEDITKKIGIKTRLIATSISAMMAGYFLNTWITQVDIPGIDHTLAIFWVSATFTVLAVSGLVNAYNIIDGFNGLASMVGIISLLAIGYVAFKVNDLVLASSCLVLIGAIGGFFIWNYPRGLIFLGDGGAYLIGFFVAALSLLLVKRNITVSPWFALLINAYPIFETLFTIWRRKVHKGSNPGLPDGAHFHSLIYRRVIRWSKINPSKSTLIHIKNAKTSPYLWILSSLAVLPALIWWNSTWQLQCFTLLFLVTYLWLYNSIVKFRAPRIFKWILVKLDFW